MGAWPPGTSEAVRFDRFMDAALYDPAHGFYTAAGGVAGRRGDFLTSVEVGPLFGAVLATWLDALWRGLGRPAPFVVAEAGAGPGTLARSLTAAGPACAGALQLVLAERSPSARSLQPAGVGRYETLEQAPGTFHAVVANELLDNLPVRILQRGGDHDGWREVWIGAAGEELHPADPAIAVRAERLAGGATGGVVRIPLADVAARWVQATRHRLRIGGRLLVFDYGASTAELARRPSAEWLRTYRRHGRGAGVADEPGQQDITCEVPFDQLAPPAVGEDQASWLRRHGIERLVEEGRRIWAQRAGQGDLAALRARSRIREAEALLDPAGLGHFEVLEWPALDGGEEPIPPRPAAGPNDPPAS